MNWDRIEGKWQQLTGKVREKWGELTEDDVARVAGKRDRLAGLLQEKYGLAKDAVERQIDDFVDEYDGGSESARP